MSTAATQTRTAQLLNAEQLREQQETSGREGLASLLKAVRRMLEWLLMPFRIVGRVLFKPRLAVAENTAPVSTLAAVRDAAFANASPDEKSLGSLMDGASTGQSDDRELDGLMRQVAENPDGSLDVELTGEPDDLDVVVPMLMRHIDQILKTHLPSDAQEAQVASHLVALAETAECARYAHRLVSWEVERMQRSVMADPKYAGLSTQTIEGLLRSAAQSPDAASAFGDGSAEQRLLGRLAVRDKIEADYALQMRQMAVALTPMLNGAKAGRELTGRGKELFAGAMRAAELTSAKLRVRQAYGATRNLPETLPLLVHAVDEAIASVAQSLEQKSAAVAAPAADPAAGEILVTDTGTSSELQGLNKADPAETVVAAEAMPASPIQAVAPAPTPVPAPKAVEAVKAAVVAVQAVRAGGMFGGVATVQRGAAELEEANMVDDVFAGEEGENLVGG